MSFTDEELILSARQDAFQGLIKLVTVKNEESKQLRDKVKPHFEAIMKAIDERP